MEGGQGWASEIWVSKTLGFEDWGLEGVRVPRIWLGGVPGFEDLNREGVEGARVR